MIFLSYSSLLFLNLFIISSGSSVLTSVTNFGFTSSFLVSTSFLSEIKLIVSRNGFFPDILTSPNDLCPASFFSSFLGGLPSFFSFCLGSSSKNAKSISKLSKGPELWPISGVCLNGAFFSSLTSGAFDSNSSSKKLKSSKVSSFIGMSRLSGMNVSSAFSSCITAGSSNLRFNSLFSSAFSNIGSVSLSMSPKKSMSKKSGSANDGCSLFLMPPAFGICSVTFSSFILSFPKASVLSPEIVSSSTSFGSAIFNISKCFSSSPTSECSFLL